MHLKAVDTATVLVAICATVVTGLVVRREVFSHHDLSAERHFRNWKEVSQGGHREGNPEARVQVVVFEDFQCEFCKLLQPSLKAIRTKYPHDVAITYRHFPLRRHAQAMEAALAAECASRQIDFMRVHDALYQNQSAIGVVDIDSIGRSVGVRNLIDFHECMASDATFKAVQRDLAVVLKRKLTWTPSVIINGTLLAGVPSLTELERRIDKALQ